MANRPALFFTSAVFCGSHALGITPLDRVILPPEYGGTFGHVIPYPRAVRLGHNLELRFNWSGAFVAANNTVSREVLSRLNRRSNR